MIRDSNIPADRAQSVDKKFPELLSLECQKYLIFCIFCWWQKKLAWAVWAKHLSAAKDTSSVILKTGIVNRVWSYCSWDIYGHNILKTVDSTKNTKILYSQGLTSCQW